MSRRQREFPMLGRPGIFSLFSLLQTFYLPLALYKYHSEENIEIYLFVSLSPYYDL